MPVKQLITVIGFNSLVLIFLVGIIVVYFRPDWFGFIMSLFLGWLTGFLNLGTSEPQFPVLLLLAFGFFLGFTVPKNIWIHALVLGAFVPLSQFISLIVMNQTGLFLSDGFGSLIAFVPAFGGVYLGKYLASVHRAKRGSVDGLIAGVSHT